MKSKEINGLRGRASINKSSSYLNKIFNITNNIRFFKNFASLDVSDLNFFSINLTIMSS